MSDIELLRQVRVAQALERLLDKLDKSNEQVERITSVADNALVLRLLSEFAALRHDVDSSVSRAVDRLDSRIDQLDRDLSDRIDELERLAKSASSLAKSASSTAEHAHEAAEVAQEKAEAAHETAEAAVEVTGQHELAPVEKNEKAEQIEAGAKAATSVFQTIDGLKTRTWLFILIAILFISVPVTAGIVLYGLNRK